MMLEAPAVPPLGTIFIVAADAAPVGGVIVHLSMMQRTGAVYCVVSAASMYFASTAHFAVTVIVLPLVLNR